MDFLGLRNLTIVKRALKIIKRVKEIEFDILKIPLDDSNVFQVFAQGDTT
jgi:DNA polymerase-3 subunit alpha